MNTLDQLANQLALSPDHLRAIASNLNANAREMREVQATVETAARKGKPALTGDQAIAYIENAINRLEK